MKKIAEFSIEYQRFLNEKSEVEGTLPAFARKPDNLLQLYRTMLLTRIFDAKAIALQRTGKMGTFPSSQGQEAVTVGIGYAMNKTDVLCPYYRDQGAFFQRGVTPQEIFTYWGGDERGSCFANNKEDFPLSVPIASQCLHAAGVAYAIKMRQQKRAVVTTCGDGATSKGDFYEALNFSSVHALPVVFVINNNQWAISVPLSLQSHTKTLAQKAIAAEIPAVQIDGFDVIAVVDTVSKALARARKGDGPMVIEAVNYRLCDHTTADDAGRYRSKAEFDQAQKIEPLQRLGTYLQKQKILTKKREDEIKAACQAEIEQATKDYLAMPLQPATEMFDFLYEQLPEPLLDQYEELKISTEQSKAAEVH